VTNVNVQQVKVSMKIKLSVQTSRDLLQFIVQPDSSAAILLQCNISIYIYIYIYITAMYTQKKFPHKPTLCL